MRIQEPRKSMRIRFGMISTMAMGMMTFASATSFADDKPKAGIGPIQSVQDLEDTAKILFKLVDTNNDGQVSQKEVGDAGNLLFGGYFFRADTNGDGVLTPEEGKQARDALFAQQPLLKLLLEKAKATDVQQSTQPQATPANNDRASAFKQLAANPMRTIGNLLDSNHDQKIEATELRQAIQTGVQVLFSVADTNQDGQLTPAELNAAVGEAAKSAVQTVFQAADADRNGSLSMQEYDKALSEPAHALFRVIDANSDNQISLAELQRAEQVLADQIQRLRVPEPRNSLLNYIQNGLNAARTLRTPDQPSPGAPSPNATATAPAPR
jgi:Ca2+-binding EF-hand superfamily protein